LEELELSLEVKTKEVEKLTEQKNEEITQLKTDLVRQIDFDNRIE
jgi:hypothetical protein